MGVARIPLRRAARLPRRRPPRLRRLRRRHANLHHHQPRGLAGRARHPRRLRAAAGRLLQHRLRQGPLEALVLPRVLQRRRRGQGGPRGGRAATATSLPTAHSAAGWHGIGGSTGRASCGRSGATRGWLCSASRCGSRCGRVAATMAERASALAASAAATTASARRGLKSPHRKSETSFRMASRSYLGRGVPGARRGGEARGGRAPDRRAIRRRAYRFPVRAGPTAHNPRQCDANKGHRPAASSTRWLRRQRDWPRSDDSWRHRPVRARSRGPESPRIQTRLCSR